MELAIVKVHFPMGAIPVKGFRCPVCGDERIPGHEAEEAQALAERLGLYGLQDAQTRRLLKTGNSVAVSLDRDLLRAVLGDVEPGAAVKVGRQGDRIVIMRG